MEWSVDLKRREGGQNEKASRGHTDTASTREGELWSLEACSFGASGGKWQL